MGVNKYVVMRNEGMNPMSLPFSFQEMFPVKFIKLQTNQLLDLILPVTGVIEDDIK